MDLNNTNCSIDADSGAVIIHKSPELQLLMELKNDLKELRKDVNELKSDVLKLSEEVLNLRNQVRSLHSSSDQQYKMLLRR